MNITYTNTITTEDFNTLRASVGWRTIQEDLAQKGLENSAFIIVAKDDKKTIGMARVITDYGYTVLITDVAIKPEYQGKGIGRTMLTEIMKYIDENIAVGQAKLINLMAAFGKEGFYEKFGFERRPNDHFGAGMTQWIKK